ncbi:MAG TPA: energy transducer TonB [Bacteroidota bacterium]
MKRIFSTLLFLILVSLSAQGLARQNVKQEFAQTQDPRDDKAAYSVTVEDFPEPIGGIRAIQEKVVYPEIAKRAGVEGTVFVEVFIDESGSVTGTSIVKGIGAGCDEAAMKAILSTRFIPGKQQGKPVKVRMSIPISFMLGKQGAALKANVDNIHTLKEPTVFIVAGPKGLKRHIPYPAEAVRSNVSGVVYVDARLNDEKKTIGVNLKRGISFDLYYDVMRAVAAYKFFEDPEIPKPQADTTISIVVQFLLPKK